MPTQEVVFAARPAALLQRGVGSGRALLDGGSARSWGDGSVRFADRPCATLEVFASAWGRWRWGRSLTWRRGDPFAQWEEFQRRAWADLGTGPHVGVLSVFAYDLKHWVERLPRRLSWPPQPLLYAALYDWSYQADRRGGGAVLHAASAAALEERRRWLDAALQRGEDHVAADRAVDLQASMGAERYAAMLGRAQEYIAAGDIYQVNLARAFRAPCAVAAGGALFARWAESFPMPFAAFVDAGEWVLLSNSPECFLRIDGDRIATFPIKGTRRLEGGDVAAASDARRLAADAKERAEHVMIVDLERNDLGRVCVPGSVEVGDFMAVERFPLLQHMVSEVRGRLLPGVSPARILRATFPGGSITGAPKVRAMQIIEELEPTARGFYTGALGWSSPDGRSCFNIAIRTALVDPRGLHFHAGGGIVADSNTQREFEETLTKADSLRRVLGG